MRHTGTESGLPLLNISAVLNVNIMFVHVAYGLVGVAALRANQQPYCVPVSALYPCVAADLPAANIIEQCVQVVLVLPCMSTTSS
jgi:hypothetical protein